MPAPFSLLDHTPPRDTTGPPSAVRCVAARVRTLARRFLPFATCLLYAACANPVAPTGGPADQIPPLVVESTPAADAVNVATNTLQIRFSEYVDPQSFPRAFSITPEVPGRVEYGWSGRTVTVRLPEALRANTTYVVTLDTNLRDAHGVALKQPITLAFSTGPTINRGRITGRLLDPQTGRGVAAVDVFAYALSDTLPPAVFPGRPDYRTQTDPGGQFTLSYLNEQPYFVVALEDRNRNRKPDPLESFAVPPRPIFVADTSGTTAEVPWFMTRLDTVPPEPDRVRALSDRRIEVRFSEPVALTSTDPEGWALQDSLTGAAVPVRAVYTLPSAARQVFVLSDPLQADRTYRIRPAAVVDSAANVVRPVARAFTAMAQPDTTRPRFMAFVPDSALAAEDGVHVLRPGQPFGLRFNQPVPEDILADAVTLQDTTGTVLPFTLRSPDGTAYLITPNPPVAAGIPMRVALSGRPLSGADTLYSRTFAYPPPSELGELSGYVAPTDRTRIVVELYPSGSERPLHVQPADSTGRFFFRALPEGSYRIRAFLDRDDDLVWDGGRLLPYEPAEPAAWSGDSLRTRPRWEITFPDTLRIPVP